MAETTRSQIPLGHPIADVAQRVNQQWAFWFQEFADSLPPIGSGYVVDGSAGTYAPMVISQGPQADRGSSPNKGEIYFAVDTGNIFVEQGGVWEEQNGLLSGDVTSTRQGVATLKTVNASTGEWGSTTQIPVFTVNEKGLVTSVGTVPVTAPPAAAAGPEGSIQVNLGGSFAGFTTFRYQPVGDKVVLNNLGVAGTISFDNPLPTFNNLSPLTTTGDLLTHDGTNNVRLPAGSPGDILSSQGEFGLPYWRGSGEISMRFGYGDATPVLVGVMPADKELLTAQIFIDQEFDGTGFFLSLGSTPGELLTDQQVNPGSQGCYSYESGFRYTDPTLIYLWLDPGTATQGQGQVVIRYQA